MPISLSSWSRRRTTTLTRSSGLTSACSAPADIARTAYRIRETTAADPALSFVARVGTLLVGASAMTPIAIGETPALLLGPLIVEPVFRSQGIGEALVKSSLDSAKAAGWKLVILVGDEPYYAPDGVSARAEGQSRCLARWIPSACFIASSNPERLRPRRARRAGPDVPERAGAKASSRWRP